MQTLTPRKVETYTRILFQIGRGQLSPTTSGAREAAQAVLQHVRSSCRLDVDVFCGGGVTLVGEAIAKVAAERALPDGEGLWYLRPVGFTSGGTIFDLEINNCRCVWECAEKALGYEEELKLITAQVVNLRTGEVLESDRVVQGSYLVSDRLSSQVYDVLWPKITEKIKDEFDTNYEAELRAKELANSTIRNFRRSAAIDLWREGGWDAVVEWIVDPEDFDRTRRSPVGEEKRS